MTVPTDTATTTATTTTSTSTYTTLTTSTLAPVCALSSGTQRGDATYRCLYTYTGCQRQTCDGPIAYEIYDLTSCINACDNDPNCYAGSFDTVAAAQGAGSGLSPCSTCDGGRASVGITGFNSGNQAFQVISGSCPAK